MKSKEVEVIKLLIENRDKELSISNVAKLLKKDYKNAHNIVSRLAKMSLVELQPFGRSYKVLLSSRMHPLVLEAEYNRRDELLKNKDFAVMLDSFRGLSSRFYVLLLFGSFAKKTGTRHSDIDLMFIVPDKAEEGMEREINNITGTIPLKLHITIFKEKDFMAMKNSKEATVGSEAIKKNILLHGIESYYEMMR